MRALPTDFDVYLKWGQKSRIFLNFHNLCLLLLQRDSVDAGERGAAALPEPQTPKHCEAAEVVQSMERERQVSMNLLNGWGEKSQWQVGQSAAFRQRAPRKIYTLQILYPAQKMYFITKITVINGCSWCYFFPATCSPYFYFRIRLFQLQIVIIFC